MKTDRFQSRFSPAAEAPPEPPPPPPSINYQIIEACSVLGIALPVSPAELRARFVSLSKKHHPDLNPGDPAAAVRMRDIAAAYTFLKTQDL